MAKNVVKTLSLLQGSIDQILSILLFSYPYLMTYRGLFLFKRKQGCRRCSRVSMWTQLMPEHSLTVNTAESLQCNMLMVRGFTMFVSWFPSREHTVHLSDTWWTLWGPLVLASIFCNTFLKGLWFITFYDIILLQQHTRSNSPGYTERNAWIIKEMELINYLNTIFYVSMLARLNNINMLALGY